MTRNAENYHIVHMGPFKGLDQNTDEQDVGPEYFVDGENFVCTESPGKIEERPGSGHWMVDEDGYGVVFSQPFAIIPGGGSIGGITTPPGAVPISDIPDVWIPLDEEPPPVPSDGPGSNGSVDVPSTEDTEEEGPIPPPPNPTEGGITLSANPSSGLWVTDSRDETVSFSITTDLPAGVTIAAYDWDYVWQVGTAFASDGTGSATTSTHTYTTSDPYDFYTLVKGTGSDSIVYFDQVHLGLTKEEEVPDGYIAISMPARGTALAVDTNFTVQVQYFERSTDSEAYALSTTDLDVVLAGIDGTATLMDTGGGALTYGGKLMAFTSTHTVSVVVQATLSTGITEGDIVLRAQQESTRFFVEEAFDVVSDSIVAEIVDASGDALTSLDFTWDNINEELDWTFYVRLTARDADGTTITSFAEDVTLLSAVDLSNSGWDNDDGVSITFTGYDGNSPYAAGTATTGSWPGQLEIPSTAWSDGVCTAKVEVTKDYSNQTVYDPSENGNSGYQRLVFYARLTT